MTPLDDYWVINDASSRSFKRRSEVGERREPSRRDAMKVAQHFSAGKWCKEAPVPEGRSNRCPFAWDASSMNVSSDRSSLPGRTAFKKTLTQHFVLGYFH